MHCVAETQKYHPSLHNIRSPPSPHPTPPPRSSGSVCWLNSQLYVPQTSSHWPSNWPYLPVLFNGSDQWLWFNVLLSVLSNNLSLEPRSPKLALFSACYNQQIAMEPWEVILYPGSVIRNSSRNSSLLAMPIGIISTLNRAIDPLASAFLMPQTHLSNAEVLLGCKGKVFPS